MPLECISCRKYKEREKVADKIGEVVERFWGQSVSDQTMHNIKHALQDVLLQSSTEDLICPLCYSKDKEVTVAGYGHQINISLPSWLEKWFDNEE